MTNTVVLLGAGASVKAGLPTAEGLTAAALVAAEQGRIDSTAQRLPLALNYVVSAIQFADVRDGLGAQQLPGIERLVSAVKMLAERRDLEVAPFVREWDSQIEVYERQARDRSPLDLNQLERALDKLRPSGGPNRYGLVTGSSRAVAQEIAKFVDRATEVRSTKTFERLHSWLEAQVVSDLALNPGADVAYLEPLASWSASGGVVATLNYDLTFESAAEALGVPCSRAIERWTATGELATPQAGEARLLKLHGSIDWKLIGGDLKVAGTCDEDRRLSRPAIIYGQREKLRADGPYLQLLEEFRRALWQADQLLVIGYSFRDGHLNSLVDRWIERRSSSRIVVVDPYFNPPPPFGETSFVGRLWNTVGPGRRAPYAASGQPPVRPAQRLDVLTLPAEEVTTRVASSGMDSLFEAFEAEEEPAE